jgi:hypothetical protein
MREYLPYIALLMGRDSDEESTIQYEVNNLNGDKKRVIDSGGKVGGDSKKRKSIP